MKELYEGASLRRTRAPRREVIADPENPTPPKSTPGGYLLFWIFLTWEGLLIGGGVNRDGVKIGSLAGRRPAGGPIFTLSQLEPSDPARKPYSRPELLLRNIGYSKKIGLGARLCISSPPLYPERQRSTHSHPFQHKNANPNFAPI